MLKIKNDYQELEIRVAVGSECPYTINTKILVPKEGKYYYLPTEYKNPLKVYLVGYSPFQSVEHIIMVLATVDDGLSNEQFEISPKILFKNASKAGDYYLEHKEELDFSFLRKRWNNE